MTNINVKLDAMVQEQYKNVSQEASQFPLKYEVGDILDEF